MSDFISFVTSSDVSVFGTASLAGVVISPASLVVALLLFRLPLLLLASFLLRSFGCVKNCVISGGVG